MWKLQKFSLTHFWQKFRESNGFTKEVTKELISRNIFWRERIFRFSTLCYCWNYKNLLYSFKKFREIKWCIYISVDYAYVGLNNINDWFHETIFKWASERFFTLHSTYKSEIRMVFNPYYNLCLASVYNAQNRYISKVMNARNEIRFYERKSEKYSLLSNKHWIT